MKFRLLSLKLPNWWIKVTIIATTMVLIIIPMHLVAVNVVFNPLRAINAANAVYKEEQQSELNIALLLRLKA